MKSPTVFVFLVLAASGLAEEKRGDAPDSAPSTPLEQLAQFHVPPGFEVQLVAAEPEIQKPINLNFDAAGRLWATGSELYPWPARTDVKGQPIPGFDKTWEEMTSAFRVGDQAPEPPPAGRDTVRILSDFAPDGRARSIVTFAENLNIPTGIQPLPRVAQASSLAPAGVAQASSLAPAESATADQSAPVGGKMDGLGTMQAGSLRHRAKGDCAIVFSIPNIWLAADLDGDGRADAFEPLYEGFGFTDTHGMSSNYLSWIDGWIYGCHGFRNHSEVKDRAGRLTVFDSGNTYRFRPDGSQIEYYTHGQTNPFGLTVDPLGNFFSADSHSKPVMMLIRGGYYAGIGKQHDGLGFAPTITDDDHGSSAIAGIACYAADKFPEEYRGNLFNGNPVTRRINRDRLEWHGSTPKAIRMPDFLTCDDPWFRPVQVKLGPDGALWIADFYNPIIGHYEQPLTDPRRDHTHGRIWRVVWRGEKAAASEPSKVASDESGSARAPRAVSGASPETSSAPGTAARTEVKSDASRRDDASSAGAPKTAREARALPTEHLLPDLTTLDAGRLVEKLGDPNLIVRTLATHELVERVGKDAVPLLRAAIKPLPLGGNETAAQRAHALIAFCRIADPQITTADYELFNMPRFRGEEMLRIFALKFTAEMHPWFDPDFEAIAHALQHDSSALVSRAAWELMASWPPQSLLRDPVEYLQSLNTDDPGLVYQAKVALREYFKIPNAIGECDHEKLAITAGGSLAFDALLAVDSPEAGEFLLQHLQRTKLHVPNAREILRHVVLHLPEAKLGAVNALLLAFSDAPLAERCALADGLGQAARERGWNMPDELAVWTQRTLLAALESPDAPLADRAIAALRDALWPEKVAPLRRIVLDPKSPAPRRAAALEAAWNLAGGPELAVQALADPASLPLRKKAAELLGRTPSESARAAMLSALPIAPAELAITITASLAKADANFSALLDLLEAGKASPAPLRNRLIAILVAGRAGSLRARAEALTRDLPPEDARLDKVIAERAASFRNAKSDAAHGAQVFQQHCAVCHRFRNAGGNVGPNLDGVAGRGVQRLVEDILDPNRNVDPAFHQTIVETNGGQTFFGVNLRDDGAAITVTDATGKDATFAKADVKSRTASKFSLMPPAFETQIAPADFQDLLAHLLSLSVP